MAPEKTPVVPEEDLDGDSGEESDEYDLEEEKVEKGGGYEEEEEEEEEEEGGLTALLLGNHGAVEQEEEEDEDEDADYDEIPVVPPQSNKRTIDEVHSEETDGSRSDVEEDAVESDEKGVKRARV